MPVTRINVNVLLGLGPWSASIAQRNKILGQNTSWLQKAELGIHCSTSARVERPCWSEVADDMGTLPTHKTFYFLPVLIWRMPLAWRTDLCENCVEA